MIALLLAILTCSRLAHMAAYEDGPFDLCTRIRNLRLTDDWIGRGLRCPLCIGVWLALPLALAVAPPGQIWLYWGGIAGAQALMERVHAR